MYYLTQHGSFQETNYPSPEYTKITKKAYQAGIEKERGLSYTASGYGSKIPTEHMVKYEGRMRRVYCSIHSNCGVLWSNVLGARVIVNIDY